MRCVRVLDSFIWFYSSCVCIIECVCIDCRVRSSDQWSNRFAHDVHGTRGQNPALLGGVTEVAQPPSRPHWSCRPEPSPCWISVMFVKFNASVVLCSNAVSTSGKYCFTLSKLRIYFVSFHKECFADPLRAATYTFVDATWRRKREPVVSFVRFVCRFVFVYAILFLFSYNC